LYYVAVPNDELYITPYDVYTSGANGASLYPLTKGEAKIIDTQGKEAYLFVVTLYKNVSSQITYTWSAPLGISDLVRLAQHIAEINPIDPETESELYYAVDINNDGKLNILDLILLSQLLTGNK
jgi:hypothetical protein